MYYEVYTVKGMSSGLIELEETDKIDFYSKLEVRLSGLCVASAWHLYKS